MPKVFKFRLDAVLTHRKAIEDEAAGVFGRASQARVALEGELAAIEEQKIALMQEVVALQKSGSATVDEIQAFGLYRRSLEDKARDCRLKIEWAKRGEEEARQRFVKARQEREVLTKLKERQFADYVKEIEAAEVKLLDELATEAYARRRFEGL